VVILFTILHFRLDTNTFLFVISYSCIIVQCYIVAISIIYWHWPLYILALVLYIVIGYLYYLLSYLCRVLYPFYYCSSFQVISILTSDIHQATHFHQTIVETTRMLITIGRDQNISKSKRSIKSGLTMLIKSTIYPHPSDLLHYDYACMYRN